MFAIKAAHLLILCQVMLAVSAGGVVTTTKRPKTKPCLTKIKCDGEFCEPVEDNDGCYYCACPKYTCANTDCVRGYHCIMKQVVRCLTTPCFPTPVCEPDDPTEDCLKIKCRPFCKLVDGPDKCPKCDCPKTCEHVKCPDDQTCIVDTVICKKEPCEPRPKCIPKNFRRNCPKTAIVCEEPCEADIGPDGCYSKCSCPKTCKNKKCNDNEQCELLEVQCFRAPCFPIPTCFPKPSCLGRPNVKHCLDDMPSIQWTYNTNAKACQWFLYYGCTPSPNTFRSRGQCITTCAPRCHRPMCMKDCYLEDKTQGKCPKCICPCQTMTCKDGTECRLTKGHCIKDEPCRPKAYCVPVHPECPPHECAVRCPRDYEIDKNGCQTCVCLD